MACPKYPQCEECYFFDREPAICEQCRNGDQFEPAELDSEGLDELRQIAESL